MKRRGRFILAIDQGSSATKAVVFDARGRILGTGRAAVQGKTASAIVESVERAVRRAGGFHGVDAIGIANQRSTLARWDSQGRPMGRLVSWWERTGLDPARVSPRTRTRFRRATGLPLLANWWAGKFSRLGAPPRTGTVDSLLLAWLSRGETFATDLSNAARTGLVDLSTLERSPALLDLFGVPRDAHLPVIRPSRSDWGGGIRAVLGDAGAGLLGATGGETGIASLVLGTGAFLQVPTPRRIRPPEGLYLAPAWSDARRVRWVLEGAVPGCASALVAGLRAVGLSETATRRIAPRAPRTDLRALLAPNGLGAIGPADIEGVRIEGDWRGAPSEERLGAIYLGLAHLVARVVARLPRQPRGIVASGGLSRSRFLLAAVADLSGVPVSASREAETTARGAAMLASDLRIPPARRGAWILPRLAPREGARRRAAFEAWIRAVTRADGPSGRRP